MYNERKHHINYVHYVNKDTMCNTTNFTRGSWLHTKAPQITEVQTKHCHTIWIDGLDHWLVYKSNTDKLLSVATVWSQQTLLHNINVDNFIGYPSVLKLKIQI